MDQNTVNFISALMGLTSSLMVLWLVLKRRAKSLTLTLFCIYVTLNGVFPSFSELLAVYPISGAWFYFFNNLLFTSLIIFPVVMVIFIIYFVGRKSLLMNYFFTGGVFILLLMMLNVYWATDFIFIHGEKNLVINNGRYMMPNGPYVHLLEVWIGLFMIISIMFLFRHYIRQNDQNRSNQARIMLVGLVLPYILSLLNYSLLPRFGFEPIPMIGFLNAITSVFLAYAILRHGLFRMDLDNIVGNIVDVISGAVIAIDKSGEIFMTNKFTQNLLGYSEAELIGKNIAGLLPDRNFARFLDTVSTLFEKESNEGVELNLSDKEGNPVPVNLFVSRLEDKFKNAAGYVCFAVDIRSIKQKSLQIQTTSGQIKKQNEELENLNRMMIDRELRMVELKKEINRLREGLKPDESRI